jgi:hypothetical protein
MRDRGCLPPRTNVCSGCKRQSPRPADTGVRDLDRGYAKKAGLPMRCWNVERPGQREDAGRIHPRGEEDPCPTFGTPYAKGGLVRIGRKASKSTVRRQERYARRPRHPEGYPGSFSCPYSPECVEGKFCERRPNSVLGSSATRVSEVRVYLRLVSVGVKGFCRAGRGFCSDSKVRCL